MADSHRSDESFALTLTERQTRVAVARGEAPADLLFANARVVNTLTGEIELTNVAVSGGRIAGVGDYRDAHQIVALDGRFLVPGLIDAHVHVESSLLSFPEYARAVVPHGTLGIVTDLHEIANVSGMAGFEAMVQDSRDLPLDSVFLAPSCVPSSRLESHSRSITAADIARMLSSGLVQGLGEVMDIDAVVSGDAVVHEKLMLTGSGGAPGGALIDGHAPGLGGRALNAYLASGPMSDHESVTRDEALLKLRRGAWLMIREGSSEHNLEELLPLVNDRVQHRCMFVVDDRSPVDLAGDGDLDAVVRKAIRAGCDPITAVRLATINPATYICARDLGAIAPGYRANMFVVDDLYEFVPDQVFYRGELVARGGLALFAERPSRAAGALMNTVNLRPPEPSSFSIPARRSGLVSAIEVIPGQIVTRHVRVETTTSGGALASDPERDLLKLAVLDRYQGGASSGVGLVRGFGLRCGALASSVSHDAHNIIVVGVADADLAVAVGEIIRMGGGLVCVRNGVVEARLPLPIGGLLSTEPLSVVAAALANLEKSAASIGCRLPSPFSVLSFLALPVIPDIRLTDRGLVDVVSGTLIANPYGPVDS